MRSGRPASLSQPEAGGRPEADPSMPPYRMLRWRRMLRRRQGKMLPGWRGCIYVCLKMGKYSVFSKQQRFGRPTKTRWWQTVGPAAETAAAAAAAATAAARVQHTVSCSSWPSMGPGFKWTRNRLCCHKNAAGASAAEAVGAAAA